MGIDRSKRVTFEENAEIYDEVSTQYPEVLVEEVLAYAAIKQGGRILEIGPGPGNATQAFARRGYRILGIELGERLAGIARQRLQPYSGVEILNCAFEDWEVEEEVFDLAISADAFHWIPPKIGYAKVAQALKDGGTAAFFWNVPLDPGTDWSRAIDAVYEEFSPQVVNPATSWTFDWVVGIIRENFAASDCFGEVTMREYHWTETIAKETYLKGMRTYSSHRELKDEIRQRLYGGIGEVFDRFGGVVEMPRMVGLFLAIRQRRMD